MATIRLNNFQAQAGKGELLFEKLSSIVPMIQSFAGCEACQIFRGTSDEDHIVILEEWSSEDAHKKALAEVPPETFGPVMALLAEAPSGGYFKR